MRNSDRFRAIQCRLGATVKRHRLAKGLTQEELALEANMGWRHLQKIEAGEVNTTLLTLTRLATALDTDPSALLAPERAD